jgi:hypothetical protein
MEAISSSETSIDFQQATRRYIPEDITFRFTLYLQLYRHAILFTCHQIIILFHPSVTIFIIIIIRGVRLSPLGTAANISLLCKAQIINDGDCGANGGMRIGRGTEVLGANLLQCHFVRHKSHMTRPGREPGPPRWQPSYDVANYPSITVAAPAKA